MEEGIEFRIIIPAEVPRLSDMANAVIRLSVFAESLATEDRTLVRHAGGRAENVAEHSNKLSIIAPALAEKFYPHLDANLVCRYASLHDGPEGYVGDTPTQDYNNVDFKGKKEREDAGQHQLNIDFAGLPGFVKIINDYELQQNPESRFVRVLDKLMPTVQHLLDNGETLRSYTTKKEILNRSPIRNEDLLRDYPEYKDLIDLKQELTYLAAELID